MDKRKEILKELYKDGYEDGTRLGAIDKEIINEVLIKLNMLLPTETEIEEIISKYINFTNLCNKNHGEVYKDIASNIAVQMRRKDERRG